MKKNEQILVFYIGVKDVDTTKMSIKDYMSIAYNNLCPKTFKGETIFIPCNVSDSRVEMINPIYITDKNLILKHELMMEELNNNIKYQIKQ